MARKFSFIAIKKSKIKIDWSIVLQLLLQIALKSFISLLTNISEREIFNKPSRLVIVEVQLFVYLFDYVYKMNAMKSFR